MASWLVLPGALLAVALGETVLLVAWFNYVPTQFHLLVSPLGRFGWFREAQQRHDLYHNTNVNFMVAGHAWDRIFGTFLSPAAK